MTTITQCAGALATVGTFLLASPLAAQSAVSRADQVRDGQVRFTFSLRPGVCGYGQNIWRNGDRGSRTTWGEKYSRDVEYDVDCESGPGRIVLDKDRGEVTDVRFYIGGKWRPSSDATDLGAVGAKDAAAVLLAVTRTNDGKASRNAIFPLTLLDSVEVWRDLMRLARDEGRPRETRRQAVFWLGQLAEGPATAGLDELVGEAALDREVREQAIFALSQRPKDEGVPALIKVVRTSKDRELRKKALFWLGQSGDPRALQLIEELLAKG
jgi:hypothetical protein